MARHHEEADKKIAQWLDDGRSLSKHNPGHDADYHKNEDLCPQRELPVSPIKDDRR